MKEDRHLSHKQGSDDRPSKCQMWTRYCRTCIIEVLFVERLKKQFCHLCQKRLSLDTIHKNKQLKSLIELIQEMEKTEQELLCEAHGERLHLFCEDDDQLISGAVSRDHSTKGTPQCWWRTCARATRERSATCGGQSQPAAGTKAQERRFPSLWKFWLLFTSKSNRSYLRKAMALAIITKKIKEITTCSVCQNLMMSPVSITCGHSFCQMCLEQHLYRVQPSQGEKMFPCPQCHAPFNKDSFRANRPLESITEVFEEMDHDLVCEAHGEQLQLFCEDDGQLICWRCERALQHQGHTTALVEDVCQGYKEKLQKAVAKLSELHTECMNQKAFLTSQIIEWQNTIEIHRQKIKSDFRNLHSFLHEEEKSFLWRLEKEEEQMLAKLSEVKTKLEQKSDELEDHKVELEAKCRGSEQYLLQDVKGTLNRTCAVKLEMPEAFPLSIKTVCDVPKLYLDVKKMLRRHQVIVTLDPDTAHPALTLSQDQRQVSRGCSQQNLELSSRRFTTFPCVLGYEGFTSGKHYFEVDVGEGSGWDVGVCMENVHRGLGMKKTPEFGFWAVRLCTENGYVALTSPPTALELHERPLVVGVVLDYEAGAVSFYNMTAGSHIFTFPKASFSDTLRPFFQVYQHSPLFLSPQGQKEGAQTEDSWSSCRKSHDMKDGREGHHLNLTVGLWGQRRVFPDPSAGQDDSLEPPKRQKILPATPALPCSDHIEP